MFQTRWIVVSVLLLFSVCILVGSCAKKDKPTAPKITVEASASIGPEGGIVEVSDPSSSLYGVKVEIPKGALDEKKTITISVGPDNLSVPEGFLGASNTVQFGPDNLVFDSLVTITIPYQDEEIEEETVRIYRFNKNTLSWEIAQLTEIDTESNQLSAITLTFSCYQVMALQKGSTPPSRSNLSFDPSVDNLTHTTGPCFGEVSFVQWFWYHKKPDPDVGNLRDWHQGDHSKIAEMALKTTWKDNYKEKIEKYIKDDKLIANSLMLALSQKKAKPQILGFSFDAHGTKDAHAILVYNYEIRTEGQVDYIDFYVYDGNAGPQVNPDGSKGLVMTYDGTSFYYGFSEPQGRPYYPKRSKFAHIVVEYPRALEFVYEYFNEPPAITETKPTGEITNRQPTISAKIHYPFIDQSLIKLRLDNTDRNPIIQISDDDPHNAIVTYKVRDDLDDGEHRVDVEGKSDISECIPGKDEDDIDPVKTWWTFSISSGTGGIVGTWDLTRIVSVRDNGETYEVPPEEIQNDPLTYIFNSDHTGIQIYQGDTATFTWYTSGNRLVTDDMSYIFSVNSTTLTLTFEVADEGRTYTITHYFSRR